MKICEQVCVEEAIEKIREFVARGISCAELFLRGEDVKLVLKFLPRIGLLDSPQGGVFHRLLGT